MNLGNRASQHNFAKQPSVNITRSVFDRSHTVKDTMDFDYLNPILVDNILPGDTINLKIEHFARLATQKVPIMDNMYVDFQVFFVPYRLVWDNWEKFNGAQDNPTDSTDFLVPELDTDGEQFAIGSVFEKMGLKPLVTWPTDYGFSALPLRAHNLIYNTWYRDENLQNSVTVNKGNGPDALTDYALYKRGKRHDYFTSALPWPQKGPAVDFPLVGTAPVTYVHANTVGNRLRVASTGNPSAGGVSITTDGSGFLTDGSVQFQIDPGQTLVADLNEASSATINTIREAFMVQSIYELDARGGTRYVEILQSHWNVTSPDFRLQRPEYLGGGSARINTHVVPQTSPTDGGTPQATLAAFATSQGGPVSISKSFVEHGVLIAYMSARADITYQQGSAERWWFNQTRFDFPWPKLQEAGEQPIENREIFGDGTADDFLVFGYQERFGDIRYKPSQIRGKFRSDDPQSLDFWHMAQDFTSRPLLNSTFIQQSTPIERAIAVPDEPHLLVDLWFNYKHARAFVAYPTPATLGRF